MYQPDRHGYFDRSGQGELGGFFDEMQRHLDRFQGRGLLSVPTGNHDLPRFSVDRNEAELKALITFLFTLPALPTLYYGDEIGLRHLHDLPSKEGAYRRTGARTPMQWDASAGGGGLEKCAQASRGTCGRILIPTQATLPERRAVDELRLWLGGITGADFVITDEPAVAGEKSLRVGRVAGSIFTGEPDLNKLDDGRYTLRVEGETVFFEGPGFNSPLMAAYAFLEEDLGGPARSPPRSRVCPDYRG